MSADLIHHRGLTLDVGAFKLHGGGRSEYLTAQQTRLLSLLMADPCRVQSFGTLAGALSGAGPVSDEALKVSISRLRRSLRRLGCEGAYLLSVRGLGYIFDAEPSGLDMTVAAVSPRLSAPGAASPRP